MYFTPHSTSAMAMFGYVYLWYLMAVLVLEIWLDYRRDIVLLSQTTKGPVRWIYRLMTLGSSNISERSLHIDERVGWVVTLDRHSVGFPVARICRLHLWFDQGESVVVVAADASGVHLFGNGVGNRRGDAALHGHHQDSQTSRSTCIAWTRSQCICFISSLLISAWRCLI